MIVSLSGRKKSGKTLLAQELGKRGYTILSFGNIVKNVVCELYGFDRDYLIKNKEKELEHPLPWNDEKRIKLSELTNIDLDKIDKTNIMFKSVRVALQYLATEVIRKADPDFHVNKLMSLIKPNKNYCIDDTRFFNEKNNLENIGAICFFIIRPNVWDYSNHISETQLSWKDFGNNVIINDISYKRLLKDFNLMFDYIDKENNEIFKKLDLLKLLKNNDFNTAKVAEICSCSNDKIVWWSKRYNIKLFRTNYYYNRDCFYDADELTSYFAGLISADGCIKKNGKFRYIIELTSTDYELIDSYKKYINTDRPIYIKPLIKNKQAYSLVVEDPYIIENIKKWNLRPRKSLKNEIPEIIQQDKELIKYWLVGLIDGDGCIYTNKNKSNIFIDVLCSYEISEYIKNMFPEISCNIKKNIKKVKGLYRVNWSGTNAVKLYKEIYKGIGLNRKWSKFDDFKNKTWQYHKTKSTKKEIKNMIKLRNEGKTYVEISKIYNLHPTSVRNIYLKN